jgi:hypothetical protein
MVKLRHLLWQFLLCLTLVTSSALAQSALTEIRDTILTPADTPFNGTVVITWTGYSASNGSIQSPLSMSAGIYNGALSVLLVPTTTASGGAFYQVLYTSSDGLLTWSETWQVPPSSVPLTVASVRTSTTPGGNGSGSGSGSSGSGSGQYATLPISISEITGLGADLTSITNNLSTLTTELNTLNSEVTALQGSSGGSAALSVSAAFVDGEIPTGTLDGSNKVFTLSQTPVPAASLSLYRNGLVQTAGLDYAASGPILTFLTGATPQPGDALIAYYRVAGTAQTVNFADSEIPGGTINSTNVSFQLNHTPSTSASLKLYKNGVLLMKTADYTLSGSTVTFSSAPQAGDTLVADYRY